MDFTCELRCYCFLALTKLALLFELTDSLDVVLVFAQGGTEKRSKPHLPTLLIHS
jgi:hypothetical protein